MDQSRQVSTSNTICTVFVNNLPPSVYRRWVWHIFLHHGKVVDVFIPKKRNVNGRCFGFVRFASKEDAGRAVKNLNGAWLIDYMLNVNFARFKPRVEFWKKSDINKVAADRDIQEWNEKNPGNAQAIDKNASLEVRVEEELGKPYKAQHKSYLKALVGPSSSTQKEQIVAEEALKQATTGLEVDVEAMHNLERCLIGTTKNFCEAKGVHDLLKSCGVLEVSVKKISGNQFLIEFENDEARNKLKLQDWAPLKDCFCILQPWSGSFHAQYRLTWINVFGVPLHVWNYSTFHNIANLWGEVISFDDNTSKFQDFGKGSMQILTSQMGRIEELVTLKCGNANVTIKVSKKEPDFELQSGRIYDSFLGGHASSSKVENDSELSTSPDDEQNQTKGVTVCNVITLGEGERIETRSIDSSFADSDVLANQEGLHLDSSEVVPETDILEAELSSIKIGKGGSTLINSKGDLLVSECAAENINESKQEMGELDVARYPIAQSDKKDDDPNTELGPQEENNYVDVGDEASSQSEPDELGLIYAKHQGASVQLHPKNKRGAKTLAELEDAILEKVTRKRRKRGRKPKNLPQSNQAGTTRGKTANASLSNSNFFNRNRILCNEAAATWEIGKSLGLLADCEDELERQGEYYQFGTKTVFFLKRAVVDERAVTIEGDFNTIKLGEERKGCVLTGVGIEDFNKFISEGEVLDLPLVGKKFTWYGSKNQRSRIDRFLVMPEWINMFRDLAQSSGGRSCSDHVPLFLQTIVVDWGPKPFKFLNCWLQHKDFLSLIKEHWCVHPNLDNAVVMSKLRKLKPVLKEWNKNVFGSIDKKISMLEKKIDDLDLLWIIIKSGT
ncbi:hypothetical protein REPUB_Repub07fG0111500 [Reevesia pubescens]